MDLKRHNCVYPKLETVLLLAICAGLLSNCNSINERFPALPGPSTGTQPTPSGSVLLEAVKNEVWHQSGNSEQQLFQPDKTPASVGDRIEVKKGGQAWLHFADALLLKLYRHGNLTIEATSDPGGAAPDRVSLEGGLLFGDTSSAQEVAERHLLGHPLVEVHTEWAIILDSGTRFLVYYDILRGPLHHFTWVVVQEGSVEVFDKSGNRVVVAAGEQTWVEPGKAPAPPIPASRAALEQYSLTFPPIDAISGGSLRDSSFLTQETKDEPATSTPVPEGAPEPTDTPLLIDTPTPWPTVMPTLIPDLPPTPVPVLVDAVGPEFLTVLQYNPQQVFYSPGCEGTNDVSFGVEVYDPSGVKSVVMTYRYGNADFSRDWRAIEMFGEPPKFSTSIDVGMEASDELRKGPGWIDYEIIGYDIYGNPTAIPLTGSIEVAAANC